jgi:prolipoprotein diacylglyceryl transferase
MSSMIRRARLRRLFRPRATLLSDMFVFSIPSPGDPFVFRLGSLQPRWYGVLLAVGVLVAGWIARKEFRRRGIDPELAYTIAVWCVPLGLIGARLYHVITDWSAFSNNYTEMIKIWHGGLGIWGAVLGGMLGVWIGCWRAGLRFWVVADCIAPGLILAQAIGRWGNYFNQELYGKPSSLPWAVKIDPAHRYAPYQADSTFQPMFLYESLWDLLVFFILLRFTRRYWRRVPAGTVFALYVALYSAVRLPLETMKIDPADHLFGQRINVWVAGLCLVAGLVAFIILFRRRKPESELPPITGQPATAAALSGHTPTARPEAAIASRRQQQHRRRKT